MADAEFGASIAEFYERHMVPLIFAPFADDLARRLAGRDEQWVLETAAGTGVVTRALASVLPPSVPIVATDVSQAMIDLSESIGTVRPVEWKRADAMALPFMDEMFDVVVCQFGFMFLSDRAKGFAEARRVLRPGGTLVLNVWDTISENEFADTAVRAVHALLPTDAPNFLATVPHGYHDPAIIGADLVAGGFGDPLPHMSVVRARSRAPSPRDAAVAFCQGTPLRHEIEARPGLTLEKATGVTEEAFAARFGSGEIKGALQAFVITVRK